MLSHDAGSKITNCLTIEPVLDGESGFSIEDEWKNYFQRQNLLSDIINGTMHPDDLLDAVGTHGHDVDGYIDGVEMALRPFL